MQPVAATFRVVVAQKSATKVLCDISQSHFGDESLVAIDCAGIDIQTERSAIQYSFIEKQLTKRNWQREEQCKDYG